MRLPRFRITVRRAMVFVAVVALVLGTITIATKRKSYQDMAASHADLESYFSEILSELEGTARMTEPRTLLARLPDGTEVRFRGYGTARKAYRPPNSSDPCNAATVEHLRGLCRERVERETQLKRKYANAASRPWLAVAPDPK